jgi:hypothetical protein
MRERRLANAAIVADVLDADGEVVEEENTPPALAIPMNGLSQRGTGQCRQSVLDVEANTGRGAPDDPP